MSQHFVVIGGANGTGKSTFVDHNDFKILRDLEISSFDYDEEYAKLYRAYISIMSEYLEQNLSLRVKDEFQLQAEEAISNKSAFSFQTNFDKIYTDKWREKFALNGFYTHLIFLILPSVQLCKERVARRVNEGGHSVPEKEIEMRYNSGLKNLDNYFHLYDSLEIVDTSGPNNELLIHVVDGKVLSISAQFISLCTVLKLSKLKAFIKNNL
jgi:predicted ABC-type ATPase